MAPVEFLFPSKGGNNLYAYMCSPIDFTTGTAHCLMLGFLVLCRNGKLGCETETKTQALIPPICKHPIWLVLVAGCSPHITSRTDTLQGHRCRNKEGNQADVVHVSLRSAVGNTSYQRALKKLRSHGVKVKNFSWNNHHSIEKKTKKGINGQYWQWRRLSAGTRTAQSICIQNGKHTVLSAASRRVQLETVQKEHRCDHSREKAPIQEAITWAGIPYPWERDTQEHYKVTNVK